MGSHHAFAVGASTSSSSSSSCPLSRQCETRRPHFRYSEFQAPSHTAAGTSCRPCRQQALRYSEAWACRCPTLRAYAHAHSHLPPHAVARKGRGTSLLTVAQAHAQSQALAHVQVQAPGVGGTATSEGADLLASSRSALGQKREEDEEWEVESEEQGEEEDGDEEEEWSEWEDEEADDDLQDQEEEEQEGKAGNEAVGAPGERGEGSLGRGGLQPGEAELVEVGAVRGAHGLKGDIRVKVLTDFPEQRFGKAGWKWFRFPGLARRMERLWCTRGRLGPGKGSPWLLRVRGVSSPEQVARLQGCVIMVEESDRPELEDGEVYSADLIGLSVLLADSEELVGTVEDVFSPGGAGEMLRVRLAPPALAPAALQSQQGQERQDEEGQEVEDLGEGRQGEVAEAALPPHDASAGERGEKARKGKKSSSGEARRVWIPFVPEIVPVLDISAGHLKISPPPGLLELNVRAGSAKKGRSKKAKKGRKGADQVNNGGERGQVQEPAA